MTTSAPQDIQPAGAPGLQAGDPGNPDDAPPDPADDPYGWSEIDIGEWHFPIVRGEGACHPEVPSAKLKTDDQKASGTDFAKIKISGVDGSKGKIKFEWTRRIGPQTLAMIRALDPHGPIKGQPVTVTNHHFLLAGYSQILINEWSKITIKGDHREIELDFKQFTGIASTAVAGASKTAKDEDEDNDPATDPKKNAAGGGKSPAGGSTKAPSGTDAGSPSAPGTSPK